MARSRQPASRKWRDGHTSSSISAMSTERLLGRALFSLLSLVLIAVLIWMLLPAPRPQTQFDALRLTDTALLHVPPLPYVDEDLAWLSADSKAVHGDVQRLEELQKWSSSGGGRLTARDALVVYIIAHGALCKPNPESEQSEPCLVPSDFSAEGLFPVRDLLQHLSAVKTRCTLVVLDCSRTPPDGYWNWTNLGFTAGLKNVLGDIKNPNLWVLAATDGHLGLNVHSAEHSLFGLAWLDGLRALKAGKQDVSLLELCQRVQRTCMVNSQDRQRPVLLRGGSADEIDLTVDPLAQSPALQFPPLAELTTDAPDAEAPPPKSQAFRARRREWVFPAVWQRGPATLALAQTSDATKSADRSPPPAGAEPAAPEATSPPAKESAPKPDAAAKPEAPAAKTDEVQPEAATAGQDAPAATVATSDNLEQLLVQAWTLRDALETPEPDPRSSPLMYAPQLWREVNARLQALEARAMSGRRYRTVAVKELRSTIESLQKLQIMRTRRTGDEVLPPGENLALFKMLVDAWRTQRESLQGEPPPKEVLQVSWRYAQAINRARDLLALEPRLAAVTPSMGEIDWASGIGALESFEGAVANPVRTNSAGLAALNRVEASLRDWLDRSLAKCTERSAEILAKDRSKRTLAEGFVLESLLSSPLWRSETRRRWRQALLELPAELIAYSGKKFSPTPPYKWPPPPQRLLPEVSPLQLLKETTPTRSAVERYRLASLLDPRNDERYPNAVPLTVELVQERSPPTLTLALKSPAEFIDLDQAPEATLGFELRWNGNGAVLPPPETARVIARFDVNWLKLSDRAGSLSAEQSAWEVPLTNGRGEFALTVSAVAGKLRRSVSDPEQLPLTVVAEAGGLPAMPLGLPIRLPVWRHVQLAVDTPFQGTVPAEPLPFKERHSSLKLELHANRKSTTAWSLSNPSPVPVVVDVLLIAVPRSPTDFRTWNWPLGRLTLGGAPMPELSRWLLNSEGEIGREAARRVVARALAVELPADSRMVPVPWGRQGKPEDGKDKPADSPSEPTADSVDAVHGLACLIREPSRAWNVNWVEVQPLDPKRFLDAKGRVVQDDEGKVRVTFEASVKSLDPAPPHPLPVDFASKQAPFQIDWPYQRTLTGEVDKLLLGATLSDAAKTVQLTARFQPQRNQPDAPAFLTVDGWPRAFRFQVPLAPSVNLNLGDETQRERQDGSPRVEIREVSSVPHASDKRAVRVYRHATESKVLPATEGVTYQLAAFPQDRRLFFAAHNQLQLAVRFEVDGSFEEVPCNAVVLKFGDDQIGCFFTDRQRSVQLLNAGRSASGELEFQLGVGDFVEVIDCSKARDVELPLKVVFLNGSNDYRESQDRDRGVVDAWQIVIDGTPPAINEFRTKELPGQVLEASISARDERSGVASVQWALSLRNKPQLMPEDFQPAQLESGRYVARFPTAEIEAKVREQPHRLTVVVEDQVGNRTEKTYPLESLPKPAAPPPMPTKEPDSTPMPGVIFGQLLYPTGVPAKGVKLAPESPNPEVATAVDGTFKFDKLQAGKEYRLRVLHTVSGKSYEMSASAKAVTDKELPKEPIKLFLQEAKKGPPKL